MHSQGRSADELMPTYTGALQNATNHTNLLILKEPNNFLKALNGQNCLGSQGCLNPWGQQYHFLPPSIVLAHNNDEDIDTKLFVGTDNKTLSSNYLLPQPSGYSGLFYQDGYPTSTSQANGNYVTAGDGTVLASSVNFDPSLGINVDPKSGEHGELINKFKNNLVSFVSGASAPSFL